MAFDLIIWGYQSNYESISANDIQPGHCAFFDFENEKDEEAKSIQILKLKGKKFQLERQTLKSTRNVNFLGISNEIYSFARYNLYLPFCQAALRTQGLGQFFNWRISARGFSELGTE